MGGCFLENSLLFYESFRPLRKFFLFWNVARYHIIVLFQYYFLSASFRMDGIEKTRVLPARFFLKQ